MNVRLFGLLAGVLVVLGAAPPLWGQDGFGGTTQTASASFLAAEGTRFKDAEGTRFKDAEGTRFKDIDFVPFGIWTPVGSPEFYATVVLQMASVSHALAGGKPVSGPVRIEYTCFGTPNVTGRTTLKVKNGNAAYGGVKVPGNGCTFIQFQLAGGGSKRLSADSQVTQTVGAQQYSPDQRCAPSTTALCLKSGRFKVELEWDATGEKGGPAVVLPRTDDSGLFFLFNETNTEALVKVVDGCNTNGKFWVFYGSLTNVDFQLTVTDTETDLVNVYTNPSCPFASVGDCDAFR